MTEEPSPDDMKDLWRDQKSEPPQISLDRFRRKSRKLRKKGKREVLILGALALFFLAVLVPEFLTANDVVYRSGLGILIIWMVGMPLRAYRKTWPEPSATDVALTTCIEQYRRELERHRDYHRYLGRWVVAPFLLGVAVCMWAIAQEHDDLVKNAWPFCFLLAVWLALFFPIRARRVKKLLSKIDKLDALKTEDSPSA